MFNRPIAVAPAVNRARYPKIEAKRFAEMEAEAARLCQLINDKIQAREERGMAHLTGVPFLTHVAIPVIRGKHKGDYNFKTIKKLDSNPAKPEIQQIESFSQDGRFGCLLALADDYTIHVDAWHINNPRGAGRKRAKWPDGMGGAGNLKSINVPKEISEDVARAAEILAWNDTPEERLKAFEAWLHKRS